MFISSGSLCLFPVVLCVYFQWFFVFVSSGSLCLFPVVLRLPVWNEHRIPAVRVSGRDAATVHARRPDGAERQRSHRGLPSASLVPETQHRDSRSQLLPETRSSW